MKNFRALILAAAAALFLSATAAAAPTVSLKAPANNASYLQPATFAASASATASSGTTLTKVEFYAGTTLIGTDTTSPYSISWTNVPAGVHSLTAKAWDNTGAATTSAVRTITVSAINTAPTASLSAPANNSTWVTPASITVSATAKAPETNDTIAKVEFYAGATLIGTDATSPYSISWASPPAGVHTLTAKSYDGQGGVTTSAVRTVTVNAANLPPTVSLSAPANKSSWVSPAAITVSATAKAPETNDTVAKVEFYAGATLIGTDTTSPYSISWASPPAGVHTLTAKAYDGQGGVTTSAARMVTVYAENLPPTVSLSGPANNSTWVSPASITVSATAKAPETNDTVAKVEFYAGATLIGTDTTSPYSISWASLPAGVHTLTAKAYDGQGGVTTSAARTVTVSTSNDPPSVSLTAPAAGSSYTGPGEHHACRQRIRRRRQHRRRRVLQRRHPHRHRHPRRWQLYVHMEQRPRRQLQPACPRRRQPGRVHRLRAGRRDRHRPATPAGRRRRLLRLRRPPQHPAGDYRRHQQGRVALGFRLRRGCGERRPGWGRAEVQV